MADKYHRDEYSTASLNVRAIKAGKEALRARGYPEAEVLDFVARFFKPDHFAHLQGRDNVFIVAPSTSRTNSIPFALASELAERFGGEVVTRWAAAASVTKAAKKGGIGKIREPVRFEPRAEALRTLAGRSGRHFVVVDDVVTTGETTDAIRATLAGYGIPVREVVSLGQAELRKVTPRDLERLADKLGLPSLQAEVSAVLSGRLKHRANYLERTLNEHYRSEIRAYFQDEARRIGQGPRAVQPGGERGGGEPDAGNPRLQPGPSPEAGGAPGRAGKGFRVGGNPHGGAGQGGAAAAEPGGASLSALRALREAYAGAGGEPERARLVQAAEALAKELGQGATPTQQTRLRLLAVDALRGSKVYTPEWVINQAARALLSGHKIGR